MVRKKPQLKIMVEDAASGEPFKWEGTGCVLIMMKRDKSGNVSDLSTGLMGDVEDGELLMMLRYCLDSLQKTIEDPDIAAIDLVEHMTIMRDAMLADSKGKQLMDDHETIQ